MKKMSLFYAMKTITYKVAMTLTLSKVYKKNDKVKMRAYNDQTLQAEKASFVPSIYVKNRWHGTPM